MKLYLTKMCESLIGTLDFRTGYHIHAFRGGLCIRRNAKGYVPNDGHLRMILSCAKLVNAKIYLRDVRLSVKEFREALDEAGSFYSVLFDGQKGTLNAKQIIAYQKLLHL